MIIQNDDPASCLRNMLLAAVSDDLEARRYLFWCVQGQRSGRIRVIGSSSVNNLANGVGILAGGINLMTVTAYEKKSTNTSILSRRLY